jgi:signal transduction histidine kinase
MIRDAYQSRLAILLGLFASLALAFAITTALAVDREARRERAGEAARFDSEALARKLKGALDDPDAGPLIAAITRDIAAYAGPASDRIIDFAPRGTELREALSTGNSPYVRFRDPGGEALGVVQDLPSGRLLIARRINRTTAIRPILLRYVAATALLMLALAGLTSWLATRRFRRRVARLNRVCAAVENGDLAERSAERGEDELAQLARYLDRMLDRLQDRFARMRNASDRIAHDLRTPLARVGSRLAMAQTMDEGARQEQLELAQRDIAGLVDAFNSLLDLREIVDDGSTPRVAFDLAAAAEEAADLYDASAEDLYHVGLIRDFDPVEVTGVRSLITRAVANLIDNALHAAPRGSNIRISVGIRGTSARIAVEDEGSGPVSETSDGDPSISTWGGHGLGLSIVHAIAARHEGQFELSRQDGHTVAELLLPR